MEEGTSGALEQLLKENLQLAKENNRLLRRMIHIGRVAFWCKVLVWVLVLGLPLLFIQPIVTWIQAHAAGSASLFGYPSPAEVEKFLRR